MIKIFPYLVLLIFCLQGTACQENPGSIDKTQLAREFYQAMAASDWEALANLYGDSVRVAEGESFHAIAKEDYATWLAWDSVFQPKYEILELEEADSSVVIKVSKTCKRILFLNQAPLITQEKLNFRNGKIYSLSIQEYIGFDNEAWLGRREELVAWVAEHHPELDGFVFDQTRQGGLNYLKAIDLYQSRRE